MIECIRYINMKASPSGRCSRVPILALAGWLLLSGCTTTAVRNTENICDIFEQKRGWYKASIAAEKKWGTPLTIPMAIMNQESSFKARARPPRRWYFGIIPGGRISSAYGYAQAIDGTWENYVRATGGYWRSRNKFEDALDFVHWYVRRAQRENGIARDDPYHLYLNYHEGLAGFRKRSYAGKPFLMKAAARVRQRNSVYAQQYAGCRKSLSRGWLRRLFGF